MRFLGALTFYDVYAFASAKRKKYIIAWKLNVYIKTMDLKVFRAII